MPILAHCSYVGTTGYNSHTKNFFRNLSNYHDLRVRNFTVSKNWKGLDCRDDPHGEDVDDLDKSLIKLQSLWYHDVLTDYNIHGGIGDFKHDLNIILAEVHHHYFYQDYKGPKIAYTVWENTLYPEQFFNKLKEYDQVWVPSKWQADITINQGIPAEKVKIVPEGVDVDLFKPKNLVIEGDIFRFVLFGRWDARKSTREIIQAFKNVFGNNNKVELWISVDNPYSIDGLNSTEERLKKYNLECDNIKILHFPSRKDYIDILNSSHVFISCARSEGWNLPLIEAMACGIPSIYSDCSGQLEFAEGKGVPVKIAKEISPEEIKNSYCEIADVAVGNWYEPDFKDLEDKILYCFNNYAQLKQKALKDSEEIREKFTWDNAAKKASLILEDFIKNFYAKEYHVEFCGLTQDKKGIYYKSSSDENKKVVVKIIDEFSGFLFHEEILEINNKCFFFTQHAYILSNQIFRIYDYYTKELKLEYKINTDLQNSEYQSQITNKDLTSLIPEFIRYSPFLGLSFLEIFHRKTYDFKFCKIEKGDVVFDLGSCFGLFSRYAFQHGASEVHSFEPNKELELCNKNLNPFSNYYFNNKAIHSKNVEFKKTAFLTSNFVEETSKNCNLSVNINDYIKTHKINKIDYLKIDIEGSEYDFFDTLDEDFLRNKIKKLAIEFHSNTDGRVEKIVNKLKNCAFDFEFEFPEVRNQSLGMLYAWKKTTFDFESFFSKYRKEIERTGISRLKFYEYIIPKLVAKSKPLYIIETGTMWVPLKDNMGAFTLIMADLIKNYTGGKIYTIDISEKNLNLCKEYTSGFSNYIEYIQSDSISYLKNLPDDFVFNLDLIYLDSFDLYVPNPKESANHHFQELLALYDRINYNCSIAIDDNYLPNMFIMWNTYDSDGKTIKQERYETYDKILGKGMYCHDFLIKNGWNRFESFDLIGANNLFYYEKKRLNVDEVRFILNNFYEKNKIQLPKSKNLTALQNISNSPNGLGDTLILTSLVPQKNIDSNFNDFEKLIFYTDQIKKIKNEYFAIDKLNLHKYDWGGGHCIQRLQKAFLGNAEFLPKPKLNIKHIPKKNKVAVHFYSETESSKKLETSLSLEVENQILNFLNDNGYEIYFCRHAKTFPDLINGMVDCEYFIGIDSGPMHLAAGLGIKSIIILNNKESKNIYLPKLSEANIVNSEWLYPQNVHLSCNEANELIPIFSISNLRNAICGNIYPYFSHEFLKLKNDCVENLNDKIEKKFSFFSIPISLGEIVDKITILKIKRKKIIDASSKIQEEIDLLFESIKYFNINFKFFQQLEAINLKLWEIEDKIRIKEQLNTFDDEFIDLARNVYKTNDERSEIKLQINKLYNSQIIEYKHHSKVENENLLEIINESNALGDTIAWTPIVNEFAEKKNCKINYYTPYKNLFENQYPKINFFDYSQKPVNITEKVRSIGCFNENDWKHLNLQEIICKSLSIPFKEIKAKIKIPNLKKFKFDKKYVCIATQSTFQARYWNNEGGWDKLIDYLHSLDYLVVCVDKYASFGNGDNINHCPSKVDCFLNADKIEDVIDVINNSEFFIGLSSGLSWLAWSLNKSVVLISGSVEPFFEFSNPYRVCNKNVCNGCFNNKSFILEKGNWAWCPENKKFECSREISFEMVKEKIDLCIKNLNSITENKISMTEKQKTTLINFVSDAMGDNIAHSPYADLYQKKNGGLIYVSSKWSKLFKSNNPNVKFISKEEECNYDSKIDIFYKQGGYPIQKSICDDLGLDYKIVFPCLNDDVKFNFKKKNKYVCVSFHSTAQMKYWNNTTGWRKTVSYLKDLGYDVYCIDKYKSFGIKNFMNEIPNNVIDETGDKPIEYRIAQIKNCEFFIGLSSGLSWLAWGLKKDVILISGVSLPEKEFFTPYRIINKEVCHGCCCKQDFLLSNKPWDYCPENKNFECTRTITFEMVKQKIDEIIKFKELK